MLLQQLDQSRRIGTDKLIHLFTVLEDHKGRHGTNGQLTRKIRQLINVKLDKLNLFTE